MAITAIQKVLTLDYWKRADKLKVGDYVFDRNGKIVQIKLVQHYFANICYEVEFDDHLTMEGDEHLGFLVETPRYRKGIHEYKGVQKFRRPLKFTEIEDLLDLPLKDKLGRSNYSIPTTKPIEIPHQALPIPPFVFGYWLYNKNSSNKLTSFLETKDYVYEKFRSHGYQIIEGPKSRSGGNYFKTKPTVESQLIPNVPTTIPANYLMGSAEERTELLSGILHSKRRQYSEKTDYFRFSSRHFGTVKRIQSLAESIGSKTSLIHDTCINSYKLLFRSRIKLIGNQRSKPVKVHYGRRFIKSITPIQSQMCVHIETTGDDNSILVGEGFISTC
jgi:hypothetical protein